MLQLSETGSTGVRAENGRPAGGPLEINLHFCPLVWIASDLLRSAGLEV